MSLKKWYERKTSLKQTCLDQKKKKIKCVNKENHVSAAEKCKPYNLKNL